MSIARRRNRLRVGLDVFVHWLGFIISIGLIVSLLIFGLVFVVLIILVLIVLIEVVGVVVGILVSALGSPGLGSSFILASFFGWRIWVRAEFVSSSSSHSSLSSSSSS